MKKTTFLTALLATTSLISVSKASVTVDTYQKLQDELLNTNNEVILDRENYKESIVGTISILENQDVTLKNISNWQYQPINDTDVSRIITNNGSLTLNNTSFSNNKLFIASGTANGGSIIKNTNYIKEIKDSFFENNDVKSIKKNDLWGGLIVNYNNVGKIDSIKNTVFRNNTFWTEQSAPHGAIIYNEGEIGTIDNVIFENNSMTSKENNTGGAHGVAIDNNQYGIIKKITNSKFINNKTYRTGLDTPTGSNYHASGGGLDNYHIIEEISNTLFQGNSAEVESRIAGATGGAIKNTYAGANISASGRIDNITNTKFIENHVKNTNGKAHGGAIATSNTTSTQKMTDVVFKNNYAEGGFDDSEQAGALGGAIYNTGYIGELIGDFIGNYVLNQNKSSALGGAINNEKGYNGKIEIITSNFINNYAESKKGSAFGGAIYNLTNIGNILNSNFIDNYVKGNEESKGGAIYSTNNITITADNGNSLFKGNTVNDVSNAIYMDGANDKYLDLILTSQNEGNIIFDDAIDGNFYNININTDKNSSITFKNSVLNANNLTVYNSSIVNLGYNSSINVKNMKVASTSKNINDLNPTITVDIEVDSKAKSVKSGILNIKNDISGNYNVIVNSLNSNVFEGASTIFAKAQNDTTDDTTFNVTRVIGSPYLWDVSVDNQNGFLWSLDMLTTKNPNFNEYVVSPEIISAMALHTASTEQTRSVVHNISNKLKIITSKEGISSGDDNSNKTWVVVQGENSNAKDIVDVDAKIWGVEAGFNFQNNLNHSLGLFLSYRDGKYDLSGKGKKYYSSIGSSIDINSYLMGLYYTFNKADNWLLSTIYGGIQKSENKTDDYIVNYKTDAFQYGLSSEIGHNFVLDKSTTVSPSIGLYYTQINFDNTNDNMGKLYKWENIKHLEAQLSVKLEKIYEKSEVYIKPSIIQSLSSNNDVLISGLDKIDTYDDQTLGRIEIGGNYSHTTNFDSYVWANYTYGSNYNSISLGLGINYNF